MLERDIVYKKDHKENMKLFRDIKSHQKYSLYGTEQNGFFEVAKECNVLDIVCGHQHGNNFTIKFQGIRLTFALKTDELGGFYEDKYIYLNGATVFTLNENVNIQNIFVDRNKYKI